jgi:hypothetical protein
MTALAELADALVECAAPLSQLLDQLAYELGAYDPGAVAGMLGELLTPVASLLSTRDLRAATVVLEAAAPLIAESVSLLSPLAEAG